MTPQARYLLEAEVQTMTEIIGSNLATKEDVPNYNWLWLAKLFSSEQS